MKKYDPSLIPKASNIQAKSNKPKNRHNKTPIISASDNYNIIKFSLNPSNNPLPISSEPIESQLSKDVKKSRRRDQTSKTSEFQPAPRKKLKKEENVEIPQNLNQGYLPQQNVANTYKNMNFASFFNPALNMQGFNFMNNQMMVGQEQEAMELAQKFQNIPFQGLYSLLNDPGSKELIGMLGSAVMDPTELMGVFIYSLLYIFIYCIFL